MLLSEAFRSSLEGSQGKKPPAIYGKVVALVAVVQHHIESTHINRSQTGELDLVLVGVGIWQGRAQNYLEVYQGNGSVVLPQNLVARNTLGPLHLVFGWGTVLSTVAFSASSQAGQPA